MSNSWTKLYVCLNPQPSLFLVIHTLPSIWPLGISSCGFWVHFLQPQLTLTVSLMSGLTRCYSSILHISWKQTFLQRALVLGKWYLRTSVLCLWYLLLVSWSLFKSLLVDRAKMCIFKRLNIRYIMSLWISLIFFILDTEILLPTTLTKLFTFFLSHPS